MTSPDTASIFAFESEAEPRRAIVQANSSASTMVVEPDSVRRSEVSTFSATHEIEIDARVYERLMAANDRIYPHIFDENLGPGQVMLHIQQAINDGKQAVAAFGQPDLESVMTHLSQIAVSMNVAYPLTDFNASFGAAVSFIRRASLVASPEDVTRSSLNALVSAMEYIYSHPMLDLSDASELVDKLTDEAWRGEHMVVEELVAAILDESDQEGAARQALLFPSPTVAETQ